MLKHTIQHLDDSFAMDSFTKVILKIVIVPYNYPMGKCFPDKYELSWEYKCPADVVKSIEDHYLLENITTDFDEVFSNLIENTNFAIKTKTIMCNYEAVQEKLGYAPDAVEFDIYLKNMLNSFSQKIKLHEKLDIAN